MAHYQTLHAQGAVDDLHKRVASLTKREREVLGMIGRGLSLPEIAEKLYRSHKTIESHRLSLGRKLHAGNRVELARIAITAGLAPLAAGPPTSHSPGEQRLRELHAGLATHKPAWEAMQAVHAELLGETGYSYLRRLTLSLCDKLAVRCAFVTELDPSQPNTFRTLLLADRGELQERFEHPQDCAIHLPCRAVLENGFARYDGQLAPFLARNPLFRQLEAHSYIGMRLDRADGQPMGILGLIHDQPFRAALQPEAILRLCAPRVAAELERSQLQQQLRELSDSLEEQVEQRTDALTRAHAHLQGRVREAMQAQVQLRESETRYRTLVETMSDGLAVMDMHGRINYVNERLCDMLGSPPEDLIGKRPTELIATDDQARWFQAQQRRRELGALDQYEVTLVRADGSLLPVLVSPQSLYDEHGRYVGSFGVITDISRYRQTGAP